MDEIAVRKHEALQAMANMEFQPIPVEKGNGLSNYTKISLSRIASIGVAFGPLASAVQNVFGSGGATSGLYRVTVPSGAHLAEFKNGAGNLGTVLNANNQISGQAVLNPLVCNPTMLFMAAALAGIDKKLDNIQETQREMLDFLVQKEKSELKGDLKFLGDILDHYKYNWNSDKYKAGNYIKVLDIRQGAERKLDFYREQITAHLNQKSLLHSDQIVQKQLDKVTDDFANYQLALYAHAFSSFLEVMLQENFDAAYLNAVSQKIEAHSFQYRELYTKCYEQIDSYSRSSIQSHMLRGLTAVSKTTGEAIAKMPVISKSQIDETLIDVGNRLGKAGEMRTTRMMGRLLDKQSGFVRPFVDSINAVNHLYNHPLNMLFDDQVLYLESGE